MTGKHYKKSMNGSVYRRLPSSREKGYSPKHGRAKKKLNPWKKILLIVSSVLLCVLLAACGYAAWYLHALNSVLSMDSETASLVNEVLSPAQEGEAFYALILGSDSREGSGTSTRPDEMMDGVERSDVMILVRVDLHNKQLTLVSIPRDTRWITPDGTVAKINEAYNIGGPAMTIQAVESLTGVEISHFADVHFSGFEAIVDQLGGIEVDVKTEVKYKDALTGEIVVVKEGKQVLNGQQAQIFARARHEYLRQDAARQSNVRIILMAIIDAVLDKPYYELPQTFLSMASCISTDIDALDLLSMGKSFVIGTDGIVMYSCTGPTAGGIDEAAGGLWLCYENPEGWEYLMSVVDSGADPSDIDVESMAIIPDSR